MYCANCGKTFEKNELVIPTIMPGWNKPVPTCYYDRLCYPKPKKVPFVVIKLVPQNPPVLIKCRVKDNTSGSAKYLRKYKFTGWWLSWKKQRASS